MNQFTIGKALGLSFRAFGRNIPIIIFMAAISIGLPIFFAMRALGKLDGAGDGGLDALVSNINWAFVYPLIGVSVLSMLISPMLTYRVIQDVGGKPAPLGQAFVYGLRGILPALLVGIMAGLCSLIPVQIVASILQMLITVTFFVAAPAAVAEKLGPFAALSRGATLTSGRRWGIFGMMFLIGIIQMIIGLVWLYPKLTSSMMDGGFAALRGTLMVFIIIIGVFQLFVQVVEAVSYVLLREDKEGVTHEELGRIFD